ncbi:LOW QUALITY PROTEIN: uncharacterized protein At1g15400 [Asparagus officinalis]|uniref:LOW QUALITY PROTEIN: uncharacterized protein At1g15400 n=1 Tax=Asparagus officinalis TaxID=4686 RepID=UPI00098E34A2|nr:LOW QUALITY PROTEIN: uncharacterized protein At1g15400 [Asparagus officinalis]
MAGLQRSSETFRRSGSSGLVWEDRFLSEYETNEEAVEGRRRAASSSATPAAPAPCTCRVAADATGTGTVHVSPVVDPPSPKISGCGFCAVFRKADSMERRRTKSKRTGHR